jgi:hypothetical protein
MSTLYGPNLDITIEIATLGDLDQFDALEIYFRGNPDQPGQYAWWLGAYNTGSGSTLDLVGDGPSGSSGFWGETNPVTIVAGDAIGVRANGTTLEAWHRTSSVWTMLFSDTVTVGPDGPNTGAGYVGVYFGTFFNPGPGTSPSWDNFTIAEWSGSPPTFPAPQTDGDDFNTGSGSITSTGQWETWFNRNGEDCGNDSLIRSGGQAVNTETYPCGFNAYLFNALADSGSPGSGSPLDCSPCTTRGTSDSSYTTSLPPGAVACRPTDDPVGNGGFGNSGCNNGGLGFVEPYTGPYGTVPVHPNPPAGEDLKGKDGADLYVEFEHEYYPATSPTTETFIRAFVDLADAPTVEGGRKAGGLQGIGNVRKSLGNEQGGPTATTVEITYSDVDDRLFRNLLEGEELEGDEIRIKMATRAGRQAATPLILMRAVAQKPKLLSQRLASLQAVDWLFSEFGPAGPGRVWPPLVPPSLFENAPSDSLKIPMPYLWGPKSDAGADPEQKGLIPWTYMGMTSLETTTLPTSAVPPYDPDLAAPPRAGILGHTGTGWSGAASDDQFFAVAAVKDNTISHLVLKGLSRQFDATPHSYRLVWDGTADADEYWAFMYDSAPSGGNWDPIFAPWVPANPRYKVIPATANSPYGDWEFYVDFTDPTDGDPLEVGSNPITETAEWGEFLIMAHPMFSIDATYASDEGNGRLENERSRTFIDVDSRDDILHPFAASWPYPTKYVERTDAAGRVWWLTLGYARRRLLEDHKNGVINIASNGWGRDDVGDGTGLPLFDAHACEQDWLENFILNNWTSGPLTTNTVAPRFRDGTYIMRTTSFADRQAATVDALGGRGLTCSWYPNAQKTIGDWVASWNRETGSRIGVNRHGQIILSAIDETADTSAWPRVDHVSHLFGPLTITFGEERRNAGSIIGDWDPDKQTYRGTTYDLTNAEAIAKYKGRRRDGSLIESSILREPDQLQWILDRELTLYGLGVSVVEFTGPKWFLSTFDVGEGVLLTSEDGTGPAGWVNRPVVITAMDYAIHDELVTCTGIDLGATFLPAVPDTGSPAASSNLTIAVPLGHLVLTGRTAVNPQQRLAMAAGSLTLFGRYFGIAFLNPGQGGLQFIGYTPTVIVA